MTLRDRLSAPQKSPWLVPALISCALGPVLAYLALSEGHLGIIAHSATITLALWLALALAGRRLLPAAIWTSGLVWLVVLISTAKRGADLMVFHAYDLVFYLSDYDALTKIITHQTAWLAAGLTLLLTTVWLAQAARRLEPLRTDRFGLMVATCAMAALASAISLTKEERRHTQFYWEDRYLSSFYSSFVETLQTLVQGEMVATARSSQRASLTPPEHCAPEHKPPHIILIHLESVFAPSQFAQLPYDKRLDQFFRSDDGLSHQLRVETYGGASWLTEFSVMTGLSTRAFGGMKSFVQTYMINRIGDTLPQVLTRCGYRNAMFYPMLKSFISAASFYRSVGIPLIFDAKDQNAPGVTARDQFYYANALDHIAKQLAETSAPTFTFIETMFTHWPYDEALEPQETVPGGGNDPQMNEYLRRLWFSYQDFEELKRALHMRFPGEPFLIVGYGDHHPTVTQPLINIPKDRDAEDVVLLPESAGFITPLILQGVGFKLDTGLPAGPVDVAYVPSMILQAARLPLPPSHAERLSLMQRCEGRYFNCKSEAEIRDFHRRLANAGLLKQR